MYGLKLFIQDSTRHMIHDVMLFERGEQPGPARCTGRETPSFDLTLEPGLAYNLVVAGRVEVAATDGIEAMETRIEVTAMQIEVEAR
jgi:hypothetical protein